MNYKLHALAQSKGYELYVGMTGIYTLHHPEGLRSFRNAQRCEDYLRLQ